MCKLHIFENSDKMNTSANNSASNDILLSERRIYLNKSKCKFVSVGLSYDLCLAPCVRISGEKNDYVTFSETEWDDFLSYQKIIDNNLHCCRPNESVDGRGFYAEFKLLPNCTIIKIIKNNTHVHLSTNTIATLWEVLPLIKYRLGMVRRLEFANYFKVLQKGLQYSGGDIISNALKILNLEENPYSENINTALEFIYSHPEVFVKECKEA